MTNYPEKEEEDYDGPVIAVAVMRFDSQKGGEWFFEENTGYAGQELLSVNFVRERKS